MTKYLSALSFVCLLLLNPGNASAASVTAAHTTVELVSDQKSIQPGKSVEIALKMTLDDGWHVYWKNPGDSGLTPTIAWELPQGFQAGEIHWPYPKKLVLGPLTSYGYEGTVYLISEVQIPESLAGQKEVVLKARVDWLACQVDCIPGRADLSIVLPIENGAPETDDKLTGDFFNQKMTWPRPARGWDLKAFDRGAQIEIEMTSLTDKRPIHDVYFYPERGDIIDHAMTQKLNAISNGARLTIQKSNLFPIGGLEKLEGVLVRDENWYPDTEPVSIAVSTPLLRQNANAETHAQSMNILVACLFAFLGGMILNLMPCVLPVLSLKILGLVKHTSHRSQMLFHGLIFTLGVLVSFWILAGILMVLKQAGHGIGWGFQFQSPWFVIVIALVLFICGLNLWGVFEVAIDVSPLGAKSNRRGYLGSFWGGVLATIVATPCTAPFMGTAIGFAITQPPLFAFLIFTCLALGMALPYLFLSAFPGFLKWIPKPGVWMVHLKSWLGFVLMGSVVWLIWVLGIQKGVAAVGLVLSGMLCISLGLWLFGLIQQEGVSWRKVLPLILAVFVGLILIILAATGTGELTNRAQKSGVQGIAWQDFSLEKVAQLRSEHKSVFIDFTAAWCLTCQVNDRLVFRHKDVEAVFKELKIEAIKADWTNRDEAITQALARYGKNSIPLYVFYPAGSDTPLILPELITPQLVIDELRKAVKKIAF